MQVSFFHIFQWFFTEFAFFYYFVYLCSLFSFASSQLHTYHYQQHSKISQYFGRTIKIFLRISIVFKFANFLASQNPVVKKKFFMVIKKCGYNTVFYFCDYKGIPKSFLFHLKPLQPSTLMDCCSSLQTKPVGFIPLLLLDIALSYDIRPTIHNDTYISQLKLTVKNFRSSFHQNMVKNWKMVKQSTNIW